MRFGRIHNLIILLEFSHWAIWQSIRQSTPSSSAWVASPTRLPIFDFGHFRWPMHVLETFSKSMYKKCHFFRIGWGSLAYGSNAVLFKNGPIWRCPHFLRLLFFLPSKHCHFGNHGGLKCISTCSTIALVGIIYWYENVYMNLFLIFRVEFQSKFYEGAGKKFTPFSFKETLEKIRIESNVY